MSSFTLPSGREIEIHEPTFGEFVHIVSSGPSDLEELVYAKFALIVPGMSREEVAGLSSVEGRALLLEVSRIWEGRSEEATLPLSNGGQPSSMALSPKKRIKRRPLV